jgi:hypothetical protein
VYVDDGAIFDEKPNISLYSCYLACRRILLTLRKSEFYLSRAKTKFFVDMENEGLVVLGCHIQNGVIGIQKVKVSAFLTYNRPSSFQELGKFIGVWNWQTDHVPMSADMSAPLNELNTDSTWEWMDIHNVVFIG